MKNYKVWQVCFAMVFVNEFSWSKSRDSMFGQCRRKYFFHYYGSWGGWVASEDERVKRVYYLKKLASKEIWLGSRVHDVIEFILKRFRVGEEVSLSHAVAILRKRMESDFEMSMLKEYTGFASKAHRFFEDEYGIEITDEERVGLFEKAERCLRNFYNSDVFMEIRRVPLEDWVLLEDFLSFDFEGVKVFVVVDFAMRLGGKLVLFDWKTGAERKADYEMQLGLYALYVSRELGFDAGDIEARMVYLGLGDDVKVDSFDVSNERLNEVRAKMRASILEMRKVLRDVRDNEAVEEDFAKNEGFWCERCNFRKVCLGEWNNLK
jgi:hypothetical protein